MLGQEELRRSDYLFDTVVEFVGTRQSFQVFPVPFDQVQFWTIRRQPNGQKAVFKKTQGCQDRRTFMIRNIVHHQHDATGWITLHKQVFDELQKRLAVLPSGDLPRNRIRVPGVGSQDMAMLLGARLQGWNNLLLTLLHPTGM